MTNTQNSTSEAAVDWFAEWEESCERFAGLGDRALFAARDDIRHRRLLATPGVTKTWLFAGTVTPDVDGAPLTMSPNQHYTAPQADQFGRIPAEFVARTAEQ